MGIWLYIIYIVLLFHFVDFKQALWRVIALVMPIILIVLVKQNRLGAFSEAILSIKGQINYLISKLPKWWILTLWSAAGLGLGLWILIQSKFQYGDLALIFVSSFISIGYFENYLYNRSINK